MKHQSHYYTRDHVITDVTHQQQKQQTPTSEGGKYDFDDGGKYRGKWVGGKAHGAGVCTGPQGQGRFAGLWADGFEVVGLYEWPNGDIYMGEWCKGYRHRLGVEIREGWVYKGGWDVGVKSGNGVLVDPEGFICYQGTWRGSLKHGIGCQNYSDGGVLEL